MLLAGLVSLLFLSKWLKIMLASIGSDEGAIVVVTASNITAPATRAAMIPTVARSCFFVSLHPFLLTSFLSLLLAGVGQIPRFIVKVTGLSSVDFVNLTDCTEGWLVIDAAIPTRLW